ncbi:hypothetical protein HCA81_14250 [Listeria booriae]|uniref:toxin Cry1Ac domain D-VI-related protein n=1 Tax=Listeria booriae TaxID=1552123 RepID=UPI0016279411|nr:toxin Cry1Ac domain D-VI-related protein [Listeria booriae]MBC2022214.1 hypothetical protein [Listeria booriae]
MGTHKLIQKSLKLTAVGAITFSVLAQPLSLVTHAAEATPTKSERQLLQATTLEELLTNSKLDVKEDYSDAQFFAGWRTTSIASTTSDLTSPSSVGPTLNITPPNRDGASKIKGGTEDQIIWKNQASDGTKTLQFIPIGASTREKGAIVVYQDVDTVIGKEYTLSQSGTYTANDYNTYSPYRKLPVQSINVFASNTNSTERLALVKATDAKQSTTFVAQSTRTRIYAVIGTQVNDFYTSYAITLQSTDTSGNNLFGVSLTASNSGISEAKAATDALFIDNDPTKGIKPTTNQAAIDAAQAKIDNVTDDTAKAELQTELDKAQAELDARTAEAQREAEATAVTEGLFVDNDASKGIKPTTDQAAIDAAQAKIDNVTDATVKAELQTELDKAQAELDARTAEAQREAEAKAATDALFVDNDASKGIKPTTDQAAIDAAQAKIDNVTDAAVKAELQVELDKAQAALDARTAEAQREAEAKAATDALFVDNDASKGIKPTTDQAAIDAAQEKIDNVTDATVKAELQAELDKAQAELDARTAEAQREAEAKAATDALFVDNDASKGIKPTTDQAAIDAAQEKIDNVTDATVKAELQAELDKAQAELDARTAEAQREAEAKAATNGLFVDNDTTKGIKPATNQAAIDAAQAKVDLVTDPTVKAELQAQVDKAQAELDARTAEAQREAAAKAAINDLFISNNPANNIKDTTTQAAIDAAQAKVNAVTDPTVKAELQAQVDKAQAQINTRTPINGTVARYTVGDLNITGTYSGPATALSVDINGKRYYGGTIADGTFKFYVGDKNLKPSDVVTLNFYDANKQIQKSITVTVFEALKITIADYKIGDNYLTATYNYPEITKIGIVVDGTKYWGGDVKDGNAKFFAADKIKSANADVTMNFYDASNNLIASKKVVIATASAEISTANYTVGATNITGTFAGDIRKLAVSINGTKYYGGSLTTNGTYKFYVLDKKIKATDTVIVYGYDANNGLLSQKTVTIAE